MNGEQLAWMIRRTTAELTHDSQSGHIGSVYSMADLLGVLYAEILRYRADDPKWKQRDRFVLSKGHAVAGLLAALAETGFFPKEKLAAYCRDGSELIGHASYLVPGVELSTGSLGHGVSMAAGMALAAKKSHQNYKVYVLAGDGECNEGSVWEAAMFASQFQLDNLVMIIDYNHLQSLDSTANTMGLDPLEEKFRDFGWHTAAIDGHDLSAIRQAYAGLKEGQPNVIIAHTVKGKGVPFMENDVLWHYRFPHDGWEYDQVVCALHQHMPAGIADPYTPKGIANPALPSENDLDKRHAMSDTYHPTFYALGGRKA